MKTTKTIENTVKVVTDKLNRFAAVCGDGDFAMMLEQDNAEFQLGGHIENVYAGDDNALVAQRFALVVNGIKVWVTVSPDEATSL